MAEISGELIKLIQAKSFFTINRFCVSESELWYSNGFSAELINHHFAPHEMIYLQYCFLRYSQKSSFQTTLSYKYLNRLSKEINKIRTPAQIDNLKSDEIMFFPDFYWGEQAIFEHEDKDFLNNLIRLNFIITKCCPGEKDFINYESTFTEKGYSSYENYYHASLFLAISGISKDAENNLNQILAKIPFSQDIRKLLDELTIDLDTLNRSKVTSWLFFLDHPLVKIANRIYIIDRRLFMNSIWRNLYFSLKVSDKVFPVKFGKYFEVYFKTYASMFVNPDNIYRIEEKVIRQPDWKIDFPNYDLIFEQKAGTKPDDTLNSECPDSPRLVNKFISQRILNKAGMQLNNYEPNPEKGTILIALTFEELYSSYSIEDKLREQYGKDIWVCSIYEIEKLFELSKKSSKKFQEIISSKHQSDLKGELNGRSLRELFALNKCNYYSTFLAEEGKRSIQEIKSIIKF